MADAHGITPRKIRLYESRGENSTFIDALVEDNGDLKVSGYDFGALVREMFDADDYEYDVRVPSEQKDLVLLALIERLYGGNPGAVSEFNDFLEAKGIRHLFTTWW